MVIYWCKYKILYFCSGSSQEAEEVHEEAQEVLPEDCGVPCEEDPKMPAEDRQSSTMPLVDEGELQHLRKKRQLEITLLEQQIEAEKRKREAYTTMQKYYESLLNKQNINKL